MNGQSTHLQDEIANLTEEDREIDFASVSLYIPGIQAVLATVATSTVTVLVCSLSPTGTASSVRTLVCMVLVACAGVRRPVQLRTPARGMRTVFAALRPGPLLYTLCLVIEQLTHSCATNDISEGGRFYRSILFHVCAVLAAVSGFYRSTRPRSESDNPLRLTLLPALPLPFCRPHRPGGPVRSACLRPSSRALSACCAALLLPVSTRPWYTLQPPSQTPLPTRLFACCALLPPRCGRLPCTGLFCFLLPYSFSS